VATYRCVFCRAVTEGPPERAPPCSRCGRRTVRILGPVEVGFIRDGQARWERHHLKIVSRPVSSRRPRECG
jgi:hypothetical protein